MVHLNRNLLTQQQLEMLFTQLSQLLNEKSPNETAGVLTEILGYEEKVMIAKRLVAIVLLVEGKSLYSISHMLKMSPATVATIKVRLESHAYDTILKRLGKTKKNYFAILNTIDSILHLGGILPHYNGLDRYRFF
jgi:uncharacterized protein YerC